VLKFHRFPFVEKRNNVRVELKLFKKLLLVAKEAKPFLL